MKRQEWIISGLGLLLAVLSASTTWIAWNTQRQIEQAVNTEKVLAHLQALDVKAEADKAWRDANDVKVIPIVQEHVHFFKVEWPEWTRKTDLIYRYVLKHATPAEMVPMAMGCPPPGCDCDEVPAKFSPGTFAAELPALKPPQEVP